MIKLKAWKIGKWQNLISNKSNTEGYNQEKNQPHKKNQENKGKNWN